VTPLAERINDSLLTLRASTPDIIGSAVGMIALACGASA
jgi:hypothetical protein